MIKELKFYSAVVCTTTAKHAYTLTLKWQTWLMNWLMDGYKIMQRIAFSNQQQMIQRTTKIIALILNYINKMLNTVVFSTLF
jgi:hypothetical protein